MTRITSSFVTICLISVLCCASFVNASGVSLHREISHVTNSTINLNANNNTDKEPYDYNSADVQQVASTPDPAGDAKGILYYRDDPCSSSSQSQLPFPSSLPKIALINPSNCSYYQQIVNVQNDVVGVIIIQPQESDSTNTNSDPQNVRVPAFSISYNAGQELLNKLNSASNNPSTDGGMDVIIMSMTLAPSGFGGVWQIAILVVGCVLAISFLISVAIHFRLYQLRRRERSVMIAQHQANTDAKVDVYTLDEKVVKSFPTLKYQKDNVKISVHGRRESLSPLTSDGRRDSSRSFTFNPKKIGVSMTESKCSNDVCAICLEEFTEGEVLRQLPKCSHMYHTECIDRWLTTKSSQCPLCKQDCTPPEVAKKRQKVTQLQSRLSALYSTSNSSSHANDNSRYNSETYDNQRNSTFGRILGMFGYGDSTENSQNSHTRPQGSDPFAIQQLPPVVVRPVNVDRVV